MFDKMKAVTRKKYGSPDILKIQVIEKPTPKTNEVLIRVYATTVNRTDCGILTGKPFLIRFFTGLFKPRHLSPGTDFAGKVEKIGEKVTSLKAGDRVWGLNDEGLSSQAQYMTIRENKAICLIPPNITYEEAVSCAEGAHYAYNFINKAKLKKGNKVLVNGATGGIGSALVQMLRHYGIMVTAVGNTKNIELLKILGAYKIFDHTKEDFTRSSDKYDVIFDAVGKSSFHKCKHLLVPQGIYISSELGPHAENLYLPLITKLTQKKRVLFPVPMNCKRSIQFVNQLLEDGEFRAVIDRKYPMENIKEAYEYVATGRKTGNVIIDYQ